MILSYSGSWNLESLYERGIGWVEQFGYDIELAGAAFLGTHMRQIAAEETAARLEAILRREVGTDKLALDMTGKPDSNIVLLQALLSGFSTDPALEG